MAVGEGEVRETEEEGIDVLTGEVTCVSIWANLPPSRLKERFSINKGRLRVATAKEVSETKISGGKL